MVWEGSIWSILCNNHASQFCVVWVLAEGALCSTDEDIKQHWTQYWPLHYTNSDLLPDELCAQLFSQFQPASLYANPYFASLRM